MSVDRERQPLLLAFEEVESTPVYPIIHMVKNDICHYIDTTLTREALEGPDLTYTLVRPLEDKYIAIQEENKSVVFCLLLNRVHFLRDQMLTTAPLSRSRAELCEILASRILRAHGTGDNTLQLTLTMTTSWSVYAGASEEVKRMLQEEGEELDDRVGNAIELAIISRAKRFIKSSAAQKVINSIWSGRCVYQAYSSHSFLTDTYKRTPIHFYDPHKAPVLDHYRLKVPAIRSVLEYINFLVLMALFVWALEGSEEKRINTPEIAFMVYGFGFALEKLASMQEHGVKVYFTGTWNGFDVVFVSLFLSYSSTRLWGILADNHSARHTGMDILAVIAVLMFPRLAFVTLRNNLMVLSLRAMIVQFLILMLLAAFCFAGFLYALWTLSRTRSAYPAGQIAWWMLDLWFGLDASGFDRADQFHPVFGPVLIVLYACLSNTLLLTVLVSILSHTFAIISEDAAAEAMFRRAVSTIEGVKADPLFSYQPPVNLLALAVMWPASFILTPRWFHKTNVFMIRLTSFPLLLIIAWYERTSRKTGTTGFFNTLTAMVEKAYESLPKGITKRLTLFEGLAGSGADIDLVFEIEDERASAVSDSEDPPINGYGTRAIPTRSPRNKSEPLPPVGEGSSPSGSPPPHLPRGSLPPVNLSSSPPPRHRATSLLHMHKPATPMPPMSPLAQVYKPFAIDTMVPEEAVASSGSATGSGGAGLSSSPEPPAGVSYGPVTRRRRLSSVHARDFGAHLSPPAGMAGGARKASGGAAGRMMFPISSSPQENEEDPRKKESIETASQVEEDESRTGTGNIVTDDLEKRLKKMEEMQERMEALLKKIASAVGSEK